ncbi:Chromosome III, complete sequence, related [Eimeria praecox]|uniref:Chromosome III, complete sequence, related n=1 Tax=Eimeria praecox TaxID=51316 RepID=U6G8D2_9EIME|nr:Chromosome III, complete sequence, related [Eimeria praecox]
MAGKHRKRRLLPPKVPLHPSAAAAAVATERAAPGVTTPAAPQQDMTLFEAYRDLQLRWKRTTRQSRKKFCIARKWRQHLACQPYPEPSWLLFLHPQMGPAAERAEAHGGPSKHLRVGRRRANTPQQQSRDSSTHELQQKTEHPSAPRHQPQYRQQEQPKHPQEKQNQCQQHDPQQMQQQAATAVDCVGDSGGPCPDREAAQEAGGIRHWVTLIRIEEIEVDVQMKEDPPPEPPKRLLDLWANRWLYPEELEGIKTNAEGKPLVEAVYDGAEHQQGTYHRRGLTACYRWLPDPKATHWKR